MFFPDAEDGACEIGGQVRVGGEVSGGHGAVEKEAKTNLRFSVTLCNCPVVDLQVQILQNTDDVRKYTG